MTFHRTVFVFAKAPRIGRAKTRLARSLDSSEALRINRAITSQVLRQVQDSRWRTVLLVAPDREIFACAPGVWPYSLEKRPQGHGDLGARLRRAFLTAPKGAALAIATDAPDVDSSKLWRAFDALRSHDAVFGPADDGGFWVCGFRTGKRAPLPFAPVRWSSPHALADVVKNLGPKAKTAYLETLVDIDDAESWALWLSRRRSA